MLVTADHPAGGPVNVSLEVIRQSITYAVSVENLTNTLTADVECLRHVCPAQSGRNKNTVQLIWLCIRFRHMLHD